MKRGESLSADSVKGNIGGEESCPKRISESFLRSLQLLHCLSKKIYSKDLYYFSKLLEYSFYVGKKKGMESKHKATESVKD